MTRYVVVACSDASINISTSITKNGTHSRNRVNASGPKAGWVMLQSNRIRTCRAWMRDLYVIVVSLNGPKRKACYGRTVLDRYGPDRGMARRPDHRLTERSIAEPRCGPDRLSRRGVPGPQARHRSGARLDRKSVV